MGLLTGCGHATTGGHDVPVLEVKAGQCVVPPAKVALELSQVRIVACTERHTQEAYASVKYTSPANAPTGDLYPGADALKKFADGGCAQRYEGYVGVSYSNSSLFFTYLLPSARSWQVGDRSVTCFITTTGQSLTKSVKGSKL